MANSSVPKKAWAIGLASLVILVPLVIFSYLYFFSPVTTVIIIRHAEKSATPPDNPGLSPEGQARAQLIINLLGDAGVKAVYASQFARTQQTVQPIAQHLGLPVTVVNADDARGLASQILSQHAGETVLIASHSNKIPLIIGALHGGSIPEIAETEYNKMFIVTVYRWRKAKVVMLKYGSPG
ncbi:MAG TPA: phosphoglycerate mutase family protein [Pyrinomonadaceae bacterium]|nr:phosphoglycerate mutase family protein [Pyrinomonadaceae bacterium]